MYNISKNNKELIYSSFKKGNNTVIIKSQNKSNYDIIKKKIMSVLFRYKRDKKTKWIYKKGKKELRSEDRSHIARPKRIICPASY